jgi:hypothetical protein
LAATPVRKSGGELNSIAACGLKVNLVQCAPKEKDTMSECCKYCGQEYRDARSLLANTCTKALYCKVFLSVYSSGGKEWRRRG